jgi:DNA-binding transcriptional ArsR family regulator
VWLIAKLNVTDGNATLSTEVQLLDSPHILKGAADPIALQVLSVASKGPVYAREIARILNIREQAVYYHVRKLLSLGLLTVASTEQVRGALAKRVVSSSNGLAFLFSREHLRPFTARAGSDELRRFFEEFVSNGTLDAQIIVGSPEPHGTFRASARDGHYATQLALFIGNFASVRDEFAVKLDTDAKLEMAYTGNLILVGGPATNQITAEVNHYLPVKFDESNYWAGLVDGRGRRFSSDTDALIAKVKNPLNADRHVILIAGIRHVGTKAAVIALTQQSKEILSDYTGQEPFACVIRGFDQDGDGKVDRADLIASYS